VSYESIYQDDERGQRIRDDPPKRTPPTTKIEFTWGLAFDVGFKLWVVFSFFNLITGLLLYVVIRDLT
jgi:hypothetical protein